MSIVNHAQPALVIQAIIFFFCHFNSTQSSSTDGQLPEITGDPRCSVVDDTDQYRPQHEQIAVSNGTEERACRQSNV